MSDDDYLSDKFLPSFTSETTGPKTYSQLRKDALKKSQEKSVQHRTKSKRQRELESREQGLSKSLFEKAQEEDEAGLGSKNKALAMMVKMGFTPGQPLGPQSPTSTQQLDTTSLKTTLKNDNETSVSEVSSSPRHKIEPLPLDEWSGKKGIGTVKRARSPNANERIAKMAKMEEDANHRSFRDRTRQEYEERKAENRLGPAQRTCTTLDEKSGKTLNVLWLNPSDPETFPNGLIEALALHHEQYVKATVAGGTFQGRLRIQMQADALSTLTETDNGIEEDEESAIRMTVPTGLDRDKQKAVQLNQEFDPDFLEETVQFLRLQPQDRLQLVVSYLRTTYAYCFYCGTEYEGEEDLKTHCPGPEEDDHD